MPDPTPTTRDRELALQFVNRAVVLSDEQRVRYLAEFRAQAREEGREEGLGEARTIAFSEAIYLRKHLDDQHQADGAERVEKRLTALLHQPTPSGAEE